MTTPQMEDSREPTAKEKQAWMNAFSSTAIPARWPPFPELNHTGTWTDWSPNPILPENSPSSIQQPTWIQGTPGPGGAQSLTRGFQHTSLPEGYIRLLQIGNARMDTSSDTLRNLELIDVPLKSAPTYEALSYCWGDMRLCTGIFINRSDDRVRPFRVTEDLATCLHSIVHSKDLVTPIYIWVDQICINQEDANERNAQVKIMVDIYRRASRVIVWLGQEADTSWQHDLPYLPGLSKLLSMTESSSTSQVIEKVSLFGRGWFRRLWVVQEVVMAKETCLLIGQRPVPWKEVEDTHEKLNRWYESMPPYPVPELHVDIIVAVKRAKADIADTGRIDIISLLASANELNCREPRDRIFGLLGCVGNTFPSDFVDYKKPLHEVYTAATRHITEETKSLNVINVIERYHERRNLDGLPTWSPQWGNLHGQIINNREPGVCSASGNRAHLPAVAACPIELQVQGKIIDTVVAFITEPLEFEVKTLASPNHITLPELCAKVWHHISHDYQMTTEVTCEHNVPSGVIQDVVDTFLLNQDTVGFVKELSLKLQQGIMNGKFVGFFGEANVFTWSFLTLLEQYWDARSFAILKSGRTASVYETAQVGDHVAILHGLNVPCVLQQARGKEKWTFHGEAFLKGAMRGESVIWEEHGADTFTLI
ncbi:heterokaryon incompatibility protein-domain-containing protein, partial [Phaeosphaeriaceae sp. PMI808]